MKTIKIRFLKNGGCEILFSFVRFVALMIKSTIQKGMQKVNGLKLVFPT